MAPDKEQSFLQSLLRILKQSLLQVRANHPIRKVGIVKLDQRAILPKHQTPLSSGMDLHALEDTLLPPRSTALVKTGLAFVIPVGFEIQVRPRSGLSLKTPLRVPNSPGTVDADYTGDCSVILWNAGDQEFSVKAGERIGQAVLVPIFQMELELLSEVPKTERGSNGFGSTGIKK